MKFEPVCIPLTEAQRADLARQPLMTAAEADAQAAARLAELAEADAVPLVPIPWVEAAD